VKEATVMMWYAILLACGSSTDNFAVGTSLGLSNKPLSLSANAIISLLNASGAYLSATGGHILGEFAPILATIFAAIIFGYLSTDEFISYRKRQKSNVEATSSLTMKSGSSSSEALRIAVPMTLNNLAGGAAGGAAGIDALTAGGVALVASFCMMKFGHVIGKHLMKFIGGEIDTSIISGTIFGCLAILQLIQLLD
jgi:putative Mn2+ efflux pump MntP